MKTSLFVHISLIKKNLFVCTDIQGNLFTFKYDYLLLKEPAAAVKSCSAPGYTDDPLLGCYRFIKIGVGTHADAAKLCASDGGRLLLINSEEEFQAVQKILSMYIVSVNF